MTEETNKTVSGWCCGCQKITCEYRDMGDWTDLRCFECNMVKESKPKEAQNDEKSEDNHGTVFSKTDY